MLRHLNAKDQERAVKNPNVLVGYDTSDDAGVYQLSEDTALVQTLDFFTPVVDDPYTFGQIAATNALSDVYAMGGRPLTAMNIVCFPCTLDMAILAEILAGGASKVQEAGAEVVGGHTVIDNEPKYGLSLTGIVHPAAVFSNAKAQPGQALVLAKPLGNGIIMTARKADRIDESATQEAVDYMTMLNKDAAAAMQEYGGTACTDVTGFGLLGHGHEMAQASEVRLTIDSSSVPLLDGALELAQMGVGPGGGMENWLFFQDNVEFANGVQDHVKRVLFDPQTSGGLLITVPEANAEALVAQLHSFGYGKAAIIGVVNECSSGSCRVRVR